MPGNRSILFCLPVLWVQVILVAQEPLIYPIEDEDFLYREESMIVPYEFYERHADLLAHPVNLNTASPDLLEESGLFTPFQIHHLIRYRENYGQLYSVLELAALPGFRKSRIMEIAPLLTVKAGKYVHPERINKYMIMLNLGQVLPEAEGYGIKAEDGFEPAYAGSPLKTSLRFKSRMGRYFSMGLTYEKDAGESFLVDDKPEFLSAYVQYKGNRLIRQLVLGNFKLNHGLGLVNGAGFIHSPESYRVNRQSMGFIRPYSSKSEYGFERGAAVRMDLKLIRLLCWFSHRRLDLSTTGMAEESGQVDWKEYLRNTGLHRTNSELEGRDLAYRLTGGMQALFNRDQLQAGMAFSTVSTGLSSSGIKSLAVRSYPVLTKHLSLHGTWSGKGWQISGELALSDWESMALITGLKWEASDFLQGLLLLHHYGREYTGSLASAYASGSKVQNETGLTLHIHMEPGQRVETDFSGELFFYPGPRYLTQVPSYGQRFSLNIRNSGLPKLQWRIRVVKKIWQSTPEHNDPGLRPTRKSHLSRFDARIAGGQVGQWQSRLLVSFLAESQHPYPAYAAVQQFSFMPLKQVKSTLQFVVFDVRDWDNRIYLYEPGLYYSFNFPSLYGSGHKTTLVLTLKSMDKLTLAAKVACTLYQRKKNLGTGNDLITGNKKWSVDMQLRLNL